jgi:WD40 repeat protein
MARKKLYSLLILPILLLLVSQIAAQVAPAPENFVPVRSIGQNRPAGLLYEPTYDHFAWVDAAGQLVIVDAETLATQHVLYTSGSYSAYSFSRNGLLLAVAVDLRIEVWDVASGTLVARFAPDGARRVQGPLQFTRDDELLLFDSIVPAPQDLRRSENDTVILPWLWDIAAAREQRPSVLVNRVIAYPFYNVRVSMLAGDGAVLVIGLDDRIQIIDADTPDMKLIGDYPVRRLETDPVSAYRSATDPYLYVALTSDGTAVQVNTETDETHLFTLGSSQSLGKLDQLKQLDFSRAAQPIGADTSQQNPLVRLLLGSNYLAEQDYTPSLFRMIDLLVPLSDDPQQDAAARNWLLAYQFNEASGYGASDLYHPQGVNQMALSPDLTQLAMRRQSGEVAIYEIASGALVRLFTPSEPDPQGRRPFAYTDGGRTLVIDFERYDAATGERLMRAEQYTQPFDAYVITDENQLITFGGSPLTSGGGALLWRLWDIESGRLLREDSFDVDGDTIARVSQDKLRYLTQYPADDGGLELRVIDGWAGSRDAIRLPALPDASVIHIIPNQDWQRFLVVYASSDAYPLAVYSRNGERLYFDAGNNLPDAYSYEWRDARTVQIKAYAGSGIPSAPLMGLQYHPSGLPQCVVDTLPGTWRGLIPIWEKLTYDGANLNRISETLCTALTGEGAQNVQAAEGTPSLRANATAVTSYLLTPSPAFSYNSARTPAPISVPGVPTCLTARFRGEAAAYAELWREITANVTDAAQLAELNKMVCEGLLGSLGNVAPTPTVNPNALIAATPTPMEAAPQTTGGDEAAFDILTIDVETGARTFASRVVELPTPPPPNPLTLVNNFFNEQYRNFPDDPVVSPDGRFMAERGDDGFVDIYRLARPVTALVADEQNAIATRAAGAVRSIGLAPTASPSPRPLIEALPTLTPTVTLTPIPLTEAQTNLPMWGDTQAVCPARALAQLPDLPEGFNPPGTMFVSPGVGGGRFLWALDPRTGKLAGDLNSPQCGIEEDCIPSPDGVWMVRRVERGDIVISRVDGSEPTMLYRSEELNAINPSFDWLEPHTLIITYNGFLPTASPYEMNLYRLYNPDTQERSEPSLFSTPVPLGRLPFETVSWQPYGTLEVLREAFPGGSRWYLRDTETQRTQLFAQNLELTAWQPAGRFLYYSADNLTYSYDTLTQEHTLMSEGWLPSDNWSPNGHLTANWVYEDQQTMDAALMAGDLPPRLQVWNSDTGLMYTYCLPELSKVTLSGSPLTWSPDSRYLAFVVNFAPGGDIAPTPTFAISPEAPPATDTPVPLETRYQYREPRTIVLDTVTGYAAVISSEVRAINTWNGDQTP